MQNNKNITALIPDMNVKLELRNVHKVYGHDDSLPFNADIFVNDKQYGIVWNTGWGGEAEYRTFPDANTDALKQVEVRISNIPILKCFADSRWTLGKLFDALASEAIQFNKKSFKVKSL